MSLVANYTDSEDEEGHEEESLGAPEETLINSTNESNTWKSSKSLSLFGVHSEDNPNDKADEDGNSDTSSDSEDKEDKSLHKRATTTSSIQLDNPFRYFGTGTIAAKDSVLRVEFREQEAEKTALMERHVKMTETAGVALTINGKKICWNHRKGKCRFGSNCKFAHDSDVIPLNPDGSVAHPVKNFQPTSSSEDIPSQFKKKNPFCMDNYDWDNASPNVLSSTARLSGSGINPSSSKKSTKGNDGAGSSDEDTSNKTTSGKKKRPGLPQDLIPGKKAMNMYYKTKHS